MKFCGIIVALCLLQVGSIYASEPQGAQCSGQYQSPIDIRSRYLVKEHVGDLVFSNGFYELPLTQNIQSDGHSIVLQATFNNVPFITQGPLKYQYDFHSIHFHWGNDNTKGSEHTREGLPTPMEMHVVFTRHGLNFTEAKSDPKGLAVIGYFIDINQRPSTSKNPFSIFAESINLLTAPKVAQSVTTKFAIGKLAVPFSYSYVTYTGSLTTGDCNEVVTWIIAPKVLKINQAQLDVFRSLYEMNLVETADNFRSTKPLNGRTVIYDY